MTKVFLSKYIAEKIEKNNFSYMFCIYKLNCHTLIIDEHVNIDINLINCNLHNIIVCDNRYKLSIDEETNFKKIYIRNIEDYRLYVNSVLHMKTYRRYFPRTFPHEIILPILICKVFQFDELYFF